MFWTQSHHFGDVKSLHSTVVCSSLILFSASLAFSQIPAFPGALGFGANATGGRGGTVYHVTTLADSGTGSFRDAVSSANRIVIFDVGGTITLNSVVSCSSSLTIAGQTAPGGGIAIIGHEVSFSARQNEIVRFIRIRPGSLSSIDEDAINVGDGTNMIFDHVSLEFAGYNNIDAHGNVGSDAITVQNSIIGDPMSNGTEAKQGFGAHTEHLGGKMAWYYNLWVSEHNRQPLAKIDTIFVNNTEYNFQDGYTVANTSGHFNHDIINNYFITGPADPSGGNAFFQMNANQSIYSTGNLLDNNNDGSLNGSSIDPGGGGTVLSAPWSTLSTNTTVYPTAGAYYYDVSLAGALPYDQLDSLIISQIKTLGNGTVGTGAGTAGPGSSLYYDQTSTGLGNNGYGVINSGIPETDSDGDGMPDYWELANGLSITSNDAMTIAADGYANIEHYLNWLADPHAKTATNTAVDVDLWQYTSGFTNASPTYSVANASNGVVTLNSDGHTATFTPATNYFGLGSYQFGVVASDGSGYTNTVTVAIVPQSESQTEPSYLTWRGDGMTNLWAVGSGINWFDGTNLVAFSAGDTVTFDDTGSNTPAINLSGALSAGTVYVLAEQDYTFGGNGVLAGSTALFKTGSGQLNINTTNTFTGGVTINEGVVQVGDGVNYSGSIAGNITNNDTLIFNNPGTVSVSASIGGSGTLTKSGSGALTLSGTQTYTNLTTVNAGSLQFSGTLPHSDITNNGSLILAPSSPVIFTNNLSGPGTLTMSGTALLTLSNANTYIGGTTNTSGGLMLVNNSSIGNGPLTYNGGMVFVGNNAVITNDFSIPGSATSDLSMAGTNNNTGTWAGNVVNLGSGASWRPGSDGGTLIFTGNALQGGRNFIVPRGTVQFASNARVSATGTATAFGRDTSGGSRSANVTIKDSAAVTLGVCSQGGGKPGKWVMLTIQDNAQLSTGTNNFDLNNVTASGIATTNRLNGGTFLVGGFVKSTNSNTIYYNGGVLKAGMNNIAFLPVLSSQANYVQAGGAKIDDGGFAITVAAPLIHDSTLGSTPDGGLTKLGAGTLTLSGANTFIGLTLINAGTLALAGSGSIANSTNIGVAAGAVFDVSSVSGYTLGNGRTLWGNGSVNGGFTLGSGAILAPGSNSIGTLTFSNTLSLAAGSTNIFEISHSPLANDSAVVSGALTCGGTLIVTNSGATALAAGNSFKLFNAGSYNGAFPNVILPALNPGLSWNTNALTTSGVITVVPPPVINSISWSGNNFGFNITGGIAGASFYVLASTNVAAPLSNWTPLLTNQFDNYGNFNFTTDPATNAQNFYRLQQLQ
jgi:autotransporter-associated beta strand protein